MSEIIKAAIKAALVITQTSGRDTQYVYGLNLKILRAVKTTNLQLNTRIFVGDDIWTKFNFDRKYWVSRAVLCYSTGSGYATLISLLFEDGVRGYVCKGYRIEIIESSNLGKFTKGTGRTAQYKVKDRLEVLQEFINSDDLVKSILSKHRNFILSSKYSIFFYISGFKMLAFNDMLFFATSGTTNVFMSLLKYDYLDENYRSRTKSPWAEPDPAYAKRNFPGYGSYNDVLEELTMGLGVVEAPVAMRFKEPLPPEVFAQFKKRDLTAECAELLKNKEELPDYLSPKDWPFKVVLKDVKMASASLLKYTAVISK
ncbi:hypothetical protein [Ewingella americana]|uniref:Uncharacterized protein n=1 Tax=Ewingella americana TaxID=41202 RepID=A0A502GE68_9GAMM|nr:hypothetical protein [Ewingella americana]TPG60031.1 hypothetical protein EAH77_15805 [Ewingella americana]